MELSAGFWRRVDKAGPGGCWLWTGYVDERGYGRDRVGGRNWRVHRLVWEALVGPLRWTQALHHTCHVRVCVNVAHLRRRSGRAHGREHAWERRRCVGRGHRPPTAGPCRTCERLMARLWRQAHPEYGRAWKAARLVRGFCRWCTGPAVEGASLCARHLRANRLDSRRRAGSKPWQPGSRGRPPIPLVG
jgi:hypothetical protein